MRFDNEKGNWGNLVLISTIDTFRTKADISKKWGLTKQGGPLYKEKAKKRIEKFYEDLDLIEKRGNTLYLDIKSEEFKKSIQDYLKEKLGEKSENEKGYYRNILDNIDGFLDLLSDKEVREKIFDIENIIKYYESDESIAKKKPLEIFEGMLQVFTIVYTIDYIKENIPELKGLAPTFEDQLNNLAVNQMGRDIKPLKEDLERLYHRDKEKFKVLSDSYKSIVDKELRKHIS